MTGKKIILHKALNYMYMFSIIINFHYNIFSCSIFYKLIMHVCTVNLFLLVVMDDETSAGSSKLVIVF